MFMSELYCEMNLCTEGIFAKDKRWVRYCNNCGQKLDWLER